MSLFRVGCRVVPRPRQMTGFAGPDQQWRPGSDRPAILAPFQPADDILVW